MSDGIYFDPIAGWVTPADTYETDTGASLKSIMAALHDGEANNDVFDAVERLLYKYQIFILQGIRQNIAKHKGVSWYLVDKGDSGDKRALISYQDGPDAEWCHECYADEVPLWLLMALLRRIAQHKPLGDQGASDVIGRVDAIDTKYDAAKQATERGGLNIMSYSSYLRQRGAHDDDE